MNLTDVLLDQRVCIVGGPGGVGKTTTSAALALGMAALGLRVCVVTIDPAKRLATSLGLEELGNEPRPVDPERLRAAGLELAEGGELHALMLDAKRTFDDLIDVLAPDDRARDEVLGNRIYQELSSAVAGSQEFTAIAKLYDLDRSGAFDLIVLDTPPSRNALDFLDAPARLTRFFEGRALRVFLAPTGLAARLAGRSTGMVFSVLKRVTGVDLLQDLSVFFRALGGMIDGFRERATQVGALLGDPRTTFLVVASPEREPIDEAIFFHEQLAKNDLPFGAAIVNRVHHDPLGDDDVDGVETVLAPDLGEKLARRVADNLGDYRVLARRDRDAVRRLAEAFAGDRVVQVPHLDRDVHDVEALVQIQRHLFATPEERARLLEDALT